MRAISELMASGAPTERLVDPLLLLYDALMMAFGVGVWMSSPRRRSHVTGALLFVYAALGLLGPTLFEMDVRGSAGDPSADIRHLALTGVIVVFVFAAVAAGAAIRGSAFRAYSLATLLSIVNPSGTLLSTRTPPVVVTRREHGQAGRAQCAAALRTAESRLKMRGWCDEVITRHRVRLILRG